MTRVELWNEKLKALKANRHGPNGNVVKDRTTEERLAIELECLFSEMPREERESVERPEPPIWPSLIAHNSKGQLIGYEDLDELECCL